MKEQFNWPVMTGWLPNEFKEDWERAAIGNRAKRLLKELMDENPGLLEIIKTSKQISILCGRIYQWVYPVITSHPQAWAFYSGRSYGTNLFHELSGKEIAAIRIIDYLKHSGRHYTDLNLHGKKIENHPFKVLWLAYHFGRGGGHPDFFRDMIELFRQFRGESEISLPGKETVTSWMDRHPSGLDPKITALRQKNKQRIICHLIKLIDSGVLTDDKFFFVGGLNYMQKYEIVNRWWNTKLFHLRMAIRDAKTLNEMLDGSLSPESMRILHEGEEKGIPIFVTPYYLSLLILEPDPELCGADQPIRDYIFYSSELLEEFGQIIAWEKEDIVKPGRPNAAGWLLPPGNNIHRRYPRVAILIPETMGRSCGGLCVSCQRMYDFQRGNLNFEAMKLKPHESWWDKMEALLGYFENDSQICDILITGGDSLMSVNRSLRLILDAVYRMAMRKREANMKRQEGQKFAEITRVRLGTRLPVYLPMRITPELVEILNEFRLKAKKAGIRQFIIQTHFETAMEVTPEAKSAVRRLLEAGWMVTNQQVFTASASRRGHTAKLRAVLNDIGVLPYYTFTVKGYMENYHNFAPNARSIQEQYEEKTIGVPKVGLHDELRQLPEMEESMIPKLEALRRENGSPFLATDRNILNLPAVGKSQTFRVVGITRWGRRILEFDHDISRIHSPVIEKLGKITIIESKTISQYLLQLEEMGENPEDYKGLFNYSIGITEFRSPAFKYPPQPFNTTDVLTNFASDELD